MTAPTCGNCCRSATRQAGGQHAGIDTAIEEAFVRDVAMVHQMEDAACPAIAGNGGEVVKQEAHSLFAVFARPEQALEAALDILRAWMP